jgi:hypothetical protein
MTMEPVDENTRLPEAVQRQPVPVDAFNPLLRSLLSWELVERREDAEGGHHWALIDEAQERLESLTPRPRRSTAALAYLDHWCARCRQQRLTHLIEGRYLCEDCERAESSTGDVSTPRPEPKRARHAASPFHRPPKH